MPRRIGMFTLTRDRLGSTQAMLASLRASRPGHAYDHWFYDQGSTDGTAEWLGTQVAESRIYSLTAWPENCGLHVGMNRAHAELLTAGYHFILKVDNDVEFKTVHWLRKLMQAYDALREGASHDGIYPVLAPKVDGLKHPPEVYARKRVGPNHFAFLNIIGGICRLMPRQILEGFTFNERMPMAWGGDATFANHCMRSNIPMVYAEDIRVRHTLSDADLVQAMPAYAERKEYEAYIPYGL